MNKKRKWIRWISLFVFIMAAAVGTKTMCYAKTYTIKTSSKPNKKTIKKLKKSKKYTAKTRQYYTIQYYLDKLSKKGGTLKLKKGTYKIPRTLYVPSKVKIQLNSGAKVVKTTATGTKKVKSTKYLFQFVSTANSKKNRKVAKYNGTKNSSIIGVGTATIDLGKVSGATGVYVAHGKKITIRNVRFKNRNAGSYIWAEGSNNVTVDKCVFAKGVSGASYSKKMAVRLENINKTTEAFGGKWSKLDNTVNTTVNITNNQFSGSDIAIGSFANTVSGGRLYYQNGISIRNNRFINTTQFAVYAHGWSRPAITGNSMTQTGAGKADTYVYGLGVQEPVIASNTLSGCQYTVRFDKSINYGKGAAFTRFSSIISDANVASLKTNTVANISYYYILNESTRLMYFEDKTQKNFTINTATAPFHDKYTDYEDFSKKRYYYVFRSYMEQLELTGGGTITVEKGTYPITNNICIPSNVTINMRDGVTFEKSGSTAYDERYVVVS